MSLSDYTVSTPECTYYRLQVPNLPATAADMDNVTPENIANLQSIAKNYVAGQAALIADLGDYFRFADQPPSDDPVRWL